MASGKIPVSTSNKYIDGYIYWTSTPDKDNNRSSVTAELRLRRNNTGYKTWGTGTFTIVINGVSKSVTQKYEITYNSNTLMVKNTVTVPHNNDGKKTITIKAYGNISGTTLSSSSASGSAVLDNIERFNGHICIGNRWRDIIDGYICIGNRWRQLVEGYILVSGKWRKFL